MSFFNEKVALVTGGASGIGLSIVQSLLENGIKVMVDKSKKKKKLYAFLLFGY